MVEIEVLWKAIGKAKQNAKSLEKLKPLVDEYMLSWYVYGDFEERTPCQIYELVEKGETAKTKFPAQFAYTLIDHLIKCKKRSAEYSQSATAKVRK